jgi:hypothetical protein
MRSCLSRTCYHLLTRLQCCCCCLLLLLLLLGITASTGVPPSALDICAPLSQSIDLPAGYRQGGAAVKV